jgi:hypothetical protein
MGGKWQASSDFKDTLPPHMSNFIYFYVKTKLSA